MLLGWRRSFGFFAGHALRRCSCLQVLLEHRARQPLEILRTEVNHASSSTPSSTPSRRSYQDSHTFSFFDLSSLVGRDSSKSPKYPEKLLKVMDNTLQRIAMGQEAKYSDPRFRRVAAAFWSSIWADKTFQRQMRESRKVEDLILPFVTTATKNLKKEEELADGAWKYELNNQIALFLSLLSDSLHAVGPVSAELTSRMDSYRARITDPGPGPGGTALSSSEKGSSDRGHGERGDAESIRSVRTLEGLRARLTEEVGQLFGVDEDTLQQKLRGLQTLCTEQSALDDLKVCHDACMV